MYECVYMCVCVRRIFLWCFYFLYIFDCVNWNALTILANSQLIKSKMSKMVRKMKKNIQCILSIEFDEWRETWNVSNYYCTVWNYCCCWAEIETLNWISFDANTKINISNSYFSCAIPIFITDFILLSSCIEYNVFLNHLFGSIKTTNSEKNRTTKKRVFFLFFYHKRACAFLISNEKKDTHTHIELAYLVPSIEQRTQNNLLCTIYKKLDFSIATNTSNDTIYQELFFLLLLIIVLRVLAVIFHYCYILASSSV